VYLAGRLHTRKGEKEEAGNQQFILSRFAKLKKRWINGVHVGVSLRIPMIHDSQWKFVCRAIDNRMGGFMIAEVARLLHETNKTSFWILHH
jgi:putative aminopeptidase FrvX